jgi:phosphohistidine phosphatase
MELYFLRHGKAEDATDSPAGDDFSRALTSKGIEEMEGEAKALEALGVRLELILTSPLVRAKQTADIMVRRFGLKKKLQETELLAPGCTIDRLRQLLAQYPAGISLMLVGHEPDFSELVGSLIAPEGARIELKKGGVALVEVPGAIGLGAGRLRWLLPPKVLLK